MLLTIIELLILVLSQKIESYVAGINVSFAAFVYVNHSMALDCMFSLFGVHFASSFISHIDKGTAQCIFVITLYFHFIQW